MITYIKINGFKSFHNFEMEFTPFTVIAGTNASGKSNLFDAFMLLSRLADKDLITAFSEQRGTQKELFTQYDEDNYATEIEFIVEMLLNRTIKDTWGGNEELNHTRLRYHLIIEREKQALDIDALFIKHESLEKIKPEDDKWIKNILPKNLKKLAQSRTAGGSPKPYIQTESEGNTIAIKIRQDGKQGGKASPANAVKQTVLSSANSVDFKHVFATKTEMINWRFLQFNPEDLREPTKKHTGWDTITPSGKNLAGTLYRIKQNDTYNLKEISRKLQVFLPNFIEVAVIDDVAYNQFVIKIKDKDKKEYTSRVLSEGTLRILALCILEHDDKHTGLLCFEEPENGLNPFRIKDMILLLKGLSTDFLDEQLPLRQVIINTHSPVLIGNIDKWEYDANVSIWYAQMKNRVTDIQDKRMSMTITSIVPVLKTGYSQLSLEFSTQETNLTSATVQQYLATIQ